MWRFVFPCALVIFFGCADSETRVTNDAAVVSDSRIPQSDANECTKDGRSCIGGQEFRCIDQKWMMIRQCTDGCDGDQCATKQTNACKVGELDAPITKCEERAPAGSFSPQEEWRYQPSEPQLTSSYVTPLVANLTDDNNDGSIDLCDTPDVVALFGYPYSAYGISPLREGEIHVIDGASGTLHHKLDGTFDAISTPALGDIDGDGVPEIIATTRESKVAAFKADGTKLWESAWIFRARHAAGLALADVDADGDVEIIAGAALLDHQGQLLWEHERTWACTKTNESPCGKDIRGFGGLGITPVVVDLDEDGDLEIITGPRAFHHDGSQLFYATDISEGFVAVADLNNDGHPNILIANTFGITILNADGTSIIKNHRGTATHADGLNWVRPPTVHDFDGDGTPEFALSSSSEIAGYRLEGNQITRLFQSPIHDASGFAASSAFDFLGDGSAEVLYADEMSFFALNENGETLLSFPRTSATFQEYPVIADIDNDGSAEVLIVSNSVDAAGQTEPPLRALRDAEDRWIQARRIWNQQNYHVTNVREDGTIPQHAKRHWLQLNTFRTNAQIAENGICDPLIE